MIFESPEDDSDQDDVELVRVILEIYWRRLVLSTGIVQQQVQI
jgi:hypothetical protein